MADPNIAELAMQGHHHAIASLVSELLGEGVSVKSGWKAETLLLRITTETPIDASTTISLLKSALGSLDTLSAHTCIVQAVCQGAAQPLWTKTFAIEAVAPQPAHAAAPTIPAAEELSDSADVSVSDPLAIVAVSSTPTPGKWMWPSVDLGNLQKLGGQVTEQALKAVQETAASTQDAAMKATEQAMRSSINQTMNAFQIAVEEIRARRLPAQMTALTGTINVGVIQLSIRLDIPMNEDTGAIEIEIPTDDSI